MSDEGDAQEVEADELEAALARFDRGERLPNPSTWIEYREGFLAWLVHQWGSPKDRECPVCKGTEWGIAEVLALQTATFWPIPEDSEHGAYPMGQVVCGACGYTLLINVLFVFESGDA